MCAFDLVELDGRDLRLEPLTARRTLLGRLIRKPRAGLVLNEIFEHDGRLVYEHACLLGCEGIVSKRKDSRYRSGRSRDWVKCKNANAPARCGEKPKRIGAKSGGEAQAPNAAGLLIVIAIIAGVVTTPWNLIREARVCVSDKVPEYAKPITE